MAYHINEPVLSVDGDYFGMELHTDYEYDDNEFNGNHSRDKSKSFIGQSRI